jgi:phytoene desaturase
MAQQAIVIGSGFSSLSAACYLAKDGWQVKVLEKNETLGGRARKFSEAGFTFDMGPSWYWMPDVFDKFFADFGYKTSDFYELIRLDPSYRVIFDENTDWEIPANFEALCALFEKEEQGAGKQLVAFLEDAKYKYDVGINDLVYKPGLSVTEFLDKRVIGGLFKLDLIQNISVTIRKRFKSPRLIELLEFPVLFLGAKPEKTPALYSMMNYADMKLGTWYPKGGMHKIVEAMVEVANRLGVVFETNQEVVSVVTSGKKITSVVTKTAVFEADVVVNGADYHHFEQHVLPKSLRNYSEKYWKKRVMAPSCLIYYVGLNTKVNKLLHHNLFFDKDFKKHAEEIYDVPTWPSDPLMYVSVTSKTDSTAAPEGSENLFILIPVATDLEDTEAIKEQYFKQSMQRLELYTGQKLLQHVVYKRAYAQSNFKADYHAFRGNAYGLANTLKQTAMLKPSLISPQIKNLFYTGQLTVPGPGVPPAIISGNVVATQINKQYQLSV